MAPMDIDEPQNAPRPGLFAKCHFAIVCGDKIDHAEANKLLQTLSVNGGEAKIHSYGDSNLEVEGFSHIVATSFDFPGYNAACDAFIPIVKPGWIDASLAKDRLANTRQYNPNPRLFMSDVVVCCADLPSNDADAIAGGVLAMGGLHTSKITAQVTHLVALTMASEKCSVVQNRRLNVKIVLPHWFDDCLKLGKRINEGPYQLPDPEILYQTHGKAPRPFQNSNVTGATSADPTLMPSATLPPAARQLQVFKNKDVLLAVDLGIGSHLRGTLEELITGSGGRMTTSVNKSDMYICKYRDGEEYRLASRAGKEVGNLSWLYYLITNNAWTSPMRRLLHYPVVREGLPGFTNMRISLSNYSGEARTYLENLVIATGAECTKTLKQDNTHLITAHTESEKCAAARDWNIHVVNHLWLEESYAQWQKRSVTDTRYTHFPRRTNLGEVVGQTQIDRAALEEHFFKESDNAEKERGQTPLAAMRSRDQNVGAVPVPLSSALNSPNAKDKQGPQTKRARTAGDIENCRTPAASRFVAPGQENITPGSRKSKDEAAAKLQGMTPDIALYEKEKKRVGGVVYGGRRKTDEDRIALNRKRSIDEASDTDDTEDNQSKRHRQSNPQPSIHLLISGYKKWVGNPKVEEQDRKQLRSLGILVTGDPSRASHLAAPCILRTPKFVTALAYAPTVISTDFIDDCLETEELQDADKYVLKDRSNEKKQGISLSLSRSRAIENRNRLLEGRTIFCVDDISAGFEVFKAIIEANGGQCLPYRGRPGVMVPSRRPGNELDGHDDDLQGEAFLLSDANNPKTWARFRQMAQSSRKVPKIVSADWLIEVAMCQKMLPAGNYEIREPAQAAA